MANSVCRVCLIGNSRMLNVDNIHLLKIYEKLTNTKLNTETENGMPNMLCYICHWQLQRCHKFFDMAQKSNRILRDLLHNGDEETHTILTNLSLKTKQNITLTPMRYLYIGNCANSTSSHLVTIKEEPEIKEEAIADNEEMNTEELKLEKEYNEVHDVSNFKSSQQNIDILRTSPNNTHSCFFCDICNKKIASKYLLAKHMKFHDKENSYSCKRCDKAFRTKKSLTKHMQIHTGKKPYSCNRCNKAFTEKSTLIRHMQIHTGKKPYSCNRCNKAFAEKNNLNRHIRIHTGEKPFSCSSCVMAFADKSTLIRHMQIHTGEKPYLCNMCNKPFAEKNNLKRHIRIHTGEKPYSCSRCDRVFTLRHHLTRHLRIHTKKKIYSCSSCDKAFTRKDNLTQHIRIHTRKTII